MEDSNPILTVVLLIGLMTVILIVVLFAAGTFVDSVSSRTTENFGVSDPTSDRVCTLSSTPDTDEAFTVRYYNGYTWTTLTETTHYTLVGNTLTVFASAMD